MHRSALLLLIVACCRTASAQTVDELAKRFAQDHLKPLPSLHGYLQNFEVTRQAKPGADCTFDIGDGKPYVLGRDFVPLPIGAAGKFSGNCIFAGYGISADAEFGYDDYADLDVRGKVVLILRYEPHDSNGASRFASTLWSPYAALRKKILTAEARGAVAVLMVTPPTYHVDDGLPAYDSVQAANSELHIPVLQISIALADRLLAPAHTTLKALQAQIDQSGVPHDVQLAAATIRGNVDIQTEHIPAANVIALLPGAGARADEFILLTAEDAGNNAELLAAVAAKLSTGPALPRSILTVAFPGNDHGVTGAERFFSAPPIPLDKIAGVLDLGDLRASVASEIQLSGVGSAAALESIAEDTQRGIALEVNLRPLDSGGNDASKVFLRQKIPALRLYRVSSDAYDAMTTQTIPATQAAPATQIAPATQTAEATRPADATAMSQWCCRIVTAMAAMPTQAFVAPTGAGNSDTASVTARRAWLGIVPDPSASDSSVGVLVQGVLPNSPAAAAGLQNGDLLTAWNDKPIPTLATLDNALIAARAGDVVHLHLLRGDSQVLLQVTLAPTPAR